MTNLMFQVYPYRATNVQKLDDTHKAGRRDFCQWILDKDEDFPEFVIFSDEKNFTEKVRGNRQNERYWDWTNPNITEENRVQGGRKLMCWAALAEGRVILHWFAEGETEDQYNYLDMLKTKLWPVVRGRATRRQLWYQQDGARPHTTELVRDWLASKFGSRVISHKTDRPWPPYSPDLSPLDYWFWGACLAEIRRVKPATLELLVDTVEQFAASLSPADVRKAVRDIRKRAAACLQENGGHFEHILKKYKRNIEE